MPFDLATDWLTKENTTQSRVVFFFSLVILSESTHPENCKIFRIWVRNTASSSPVETLQDEADSRTTAHPLGCPFFFFGDPYKEIHLATNVAGFEPQPRLASRSCKTRMIPVLSLLQSGCLSLFYSHKTAPTYAYTMRANLKV